MQIVNFYKLPIWSSDVSSKATSSGTSLKSNQDDDQCLLAVPDVFGSNFTRVSIFWSILIQFEWIFTFPETFGKLRISLSGRLNRCWRMISLTKCVGYRKLSSTSKICHQHHCDIFKQNSSKVVQSDELFVAHPIVTNIGLNIGFIYSLINSLVACCHIWNLIGRDCYMYLICL